MAILLSSRALALQSGGAGKDWVIELTEAAGRTCHPVISERQVPRLSTALPQVKELGVVMYNCSCLARDLTKIFEAYWFLGQAGSSIPSTWPRPFDTRYNQETPMEICLNGTPALAYLAVSWEK